MHPFSFRGAYERTQVEIILLFLCELYSTALLYVEWLIELSKLIYRSNRKKMFPKAPTTIV
jgi:hypothetical protein